MSFAPPASDAPLRIKVRRWSASGIMTPAIIGILGTGLALGSYEHTQGNIHRLKQTVGIQQDAPIPLTGPGGLPIVELTRHPSEDTSAPEFTSATLLPGRGFNLWQITARLPGHGEIPLLIAPPGPPETTLTGDGLDANGNLSAAYGGAFTAPWAASLSGFPSPTGMLQTQWKGQRLTFPASAVGSTISLEGILLNRNTDDVKTAAISDGQSALATFHAGTFAGHWAGNTELSISVELTGHFIDLTLIAQNTGTTPEPFGAGWHPYFAIPSHDRASATLVLPSNRRTAPPNTRSGISTGAVLPTQETPFDFSKAGGTPLRNVALDDNFVDLHAAAIAHDPIAELRDPAFNYGLRITALTSNIKTFRVVAPSNKPWISIQPDMNVPDPFGSEWDRLDATGMVILQPGDSVQWKVRLEIFSLARTFPGLDK